METSTVIESDWSDKYQEDLLKGTVAARAIQLFCIAMLPWLRKIHYLKNCIVQIPHSCMNKRIISVLSDVVFIFWNILIQYNPKMYLV